MSRGDSRAAPILGIMKIEIAVVTHKRYPVYGDGVYVPVMAGSVGMSEEETDGYVRDDIGDNISDKNSRYCELTGLYWMWKHSDADCIGLCHYRRYFRGQKRGRWVAGRRDGAPADNDRRIRNVSSGGLAEVLNESEAAGDACVLELAETELLLSRYPVVLPVPRNYYIETNYSHFAHSHGALALDMVRAVIADRHPEYIAAYDRRMAMRRGHRFNMFIMQRAILDEYCTWLFDVLFELERRLDGIYDGMETASEASRLYGHVSERLLDVWLDYKGYSYAELPYVFIGKEHLARKAALMVMRRVSAVMHR